MDESKKKPRKRNVAIISETNDVGLCRQGVDCVKATGRSANDQQVNNRVTQLAMTDQLFIRKTDTRRAMHPKYFILTWTKLTEPY